MITAKRTSEGIHQPTMYTEGPRGPDDLNISSMRTLCREEYAYNGGIVTAIPRTASLNNLCQHRHRKAGGVLPCPLAITVMAPQHDRALLGNDWISGVGHFSTRHSGGGFCACSQKTS